MLPIAIVVGILSVVWALWVASARGAPRWTRVVALLAASAAIGGGIGSIWSLERAFSSAVPDAASKTTHLAEAIGDAMLVMLGGWALAFGLLAFATIAVFRHRRANAALPVARAIR